MKKSVVAACYLLGAQLTGLAAAQKDSRQHRSEPRITSFRMFPTSLTLSWRSEPGRTYSIESKPTLTNAHWTPVNDAIIAQGTQATWTGPRPSDTSAFYHVVRLGD